MKVRKREINIFSMSALDLFASGMGAFILLTVMGMLFFPNTGDSDERVKNIKDQLAKVRQQRDDASRDAEQARSELSDAIEAKNSAEERASNAESKLAEAEKRVTEVEQELKDIKIPALDLVVCLDVTKSMSDQIEGLKREITDLARILDAAAPSVGIGVVAFGDKEWNKPIHVQEILPSTSIGRLRSFVDSLTPGMNDPGSNPTRPEAVYRALKTAAELNWRAVSQRRFIVVLTDAPAYPERVGDALAAARKFAAQGGNQVAVVMANRGAGDAEEFLQDLADAGQGEFVDSAGGQSVTSSVMISIFGR